MEGSVQFVLLILAIFSPLLCLGEQTVPLIAWSNTRSLANKPRISAGKVVTKEELGTNYMGSILQTQPQNIFLFVFDELSIDDITQYSNAYSAGGQGAALRHLKKSMTESLSTLVLPTVEPSDLEGDLSTKVNGAIFDLKEPTLEGATLDPTKTNLVITHLSVATGDSKEEAFVQADRIMDSMIQTQKTPYTAILTAMHRPKSHPKNGDRLTIGRHLLETPTSFTAHYSSSTPKCNVYMVFDAITLIPDVLKPTKYVLPIAPTDWSTSGSDCKEENGRVLVILELSLNDKKDLDSFKLSLNFSTTAPGYWFVSETSSVEFAMSGAQSIKYDIRTGITQTPYTFSYHCTKGIFHLIPPKGSARGRGQISVKELQIQPYGITKRNDVDLFGPVNDCVGFFSEGILMGLFMGLIMLLILSFGIGMLANLKVMDKFDDPKGKTITVNVSE